jgi:hypothetical protein
MPKLSITGNMIPRKINIRRLAYYLCIFTISGYTFSITRRYYSEKYTNALSSIPTVPAYNKYIDQNGDFLPYHGYEILQFVVNPVSDKLMELFSYLSQQDEINQYFRFVPKSSYHITLAKIVDKSTYDKQTLDKLIEEQETLDAEDTYSLCNGKQVLLIDKKELRLEIELTSDLVIDNVKKIQKRWSEYFPKLITPQYSSFYITLAYQYKDIPNKDIYNRLETILRDWPQFPVDIELGPIEICSYSNLISYVVLLSDEDI